jgi:PAS domain-containing protein
MRATPTTSVGLINLAKSFGMPIVIHRNGRILFANLNFSRLVGKHEILEGGDLWGIINDVDIRQVTQTAAASGESGNVERLVRVGSQSLVLLCHSIPVECPEEESVSFDIVFDATARRGWEERIMSQRRKGIADNLWALDGELKLIWCKVDRNSLGNTMSAGTDIISIFPNDSQGTFFDLIQSAKLHLGEVHYGTFSVKRVNGIKRCMIELYFQPFVVERYYLVTRVATIVGDVVIDRLCDGLGCSSDKKLAMALNTSQSSISRARKKDELPPVSWLIEAHLRRGVSLDWLVSGIGQRDLTP